MEPVTTLEPAPSPASLSNGDELFEIVNGKRVELPPMAAYETDIASALLEPLRRHGKINELGRAVAEMLFGLDPEGNLRRRPDVAFVSYKRWPRNRRVPRTVAWEVVPELAAEIVSATNLAEEIVERIREYFRYDVRLVWVVYPTVEQVYVYTSPTQVRILTRADELDGGDVLPGFRLPLTALFEEETSGQ